jgi:excisionase family DNA binding protein
LHYHINRMKFSTADNCEEIRLLTLERAAAILQVSKRTLIRMIQQKEVPAFKVGGQWRIRESRLRKWVEQKER